MVLGVFDYNISIFICYLQFYHYIVTFLFQYSIGSSWYCGKMQTLEFDSPR